MTTYICMGIVLLFLAALVLPGAKLTESNDGFFDLTSTTAMRGFWCIVVILVHIPFVFQNKIQDMISSFGYIGVTFFFMTSAFGLKQSIANKPESLRSFWRRRLPGLLIPVLLANLVWVMVLLLEKREVGVWDVIGIDTWVIWLLICYLIFWIVYKIRWIGWKDTAISIMVIIFSLVIFLVGDCIKSTTWVTEVYGFIWGLLLADTAEKFKGKALDKWLLKLIALLAASGALGLAYLKFKPVYFWGNYLLKILLGVAITVLILQLVTRIRIGNRLSAFVGAISFEIYLLHGEAFELVMLSLGRINSGVFIVLSIALTIVLSLVLHFVAKRAVKAARKSLIRE